MAGRSGNMVRAQQAMTAAAYPKQIQSARDIFGDFLPEAAQAIVDIARGATYQEILPSGQVVDLKLPPNLNANIYIINRMLGSPRPEGSEIVDRLNTSRAVFMEQQVARGWIEAQVQEILSRAKLREMEAKFWPKQFVTEEQQQEQIQTLAEAILTKLMSLTPDEFADIIEGKDPGDALEVLKGKIGRDLGEVIEEVMTREESDDEADDDDDEETEDDAVEEL